ncbi:MAG: twin-arginine translocase TatA/TatE family subunit [Proteobacteria bacterium]|nr:twin-arginine translocase TatA/TatE family subunit [Pseudomonadota bacterium]MBU1648801.1 twin-arginine translocase TatA/TatE family subunit [Pseudomonadota bacterium]
MFGIGLPEMILILALALIVVGPDKLPDLARSMAKGVMELKKTAEALKKNLTEDGTLDTIKSDLNNAVHGHQGNLLESSDQSWKRLGPGEGVNPPPEKTADKIIEAELTVIDDTTPPLSEEQAAEKVSESTEQSTPEKESNTPPENASQKP